MSIPNYDYEIEKMYHPENFENKKAKKIFDQRLTKKRDELIKKINERGEKK